LISIRAIPIIIFAALHLSCPILSGRGQSDFTSLAKSFSSAVVAAEH